jgi:hypothetical protein
LASLALPENCSAKLATLRIGTDGVAQLTLPLLEYDLVLVEVQARASAP